MVERLMSARPCLRHRFLDGERERAGWPHYNTNTPRHMTTTKLTTTKSTKTMPMTKKKTRRTTMTPSDSGALQPHAESDSITR